MQSYYSSPHQLQAAAVAAAAAASGVQRLPFQPPFPGLHDTPGGRLALLRGLHGTTRSPNLCGPTPLLPPSGSTEETNESEMESDVISENDDDDIDSEKLDLSHREMIAKLKRRVEEEREQEEEEEEEEEAEEQREPTKDDLLLHSSQKDSAASRSNSSHRCGILLNSSSSSLKRHRQSIDSHDGHYDRADDVIIGSDDLEEDGGVTEMQTEIKVQRPLGLLAQHGLTMKSSSSSTMAKTHSHSSQSSLQFANDHHPEEAPLDWEQQKLERKASENEIPDRSRRDDLSDRDKETGGGLDFSSSGHMASLMDRRFMPSPPPLASPTGLDPNKGSSTSPSGHHWTFEEQFKQLYEMSPEPKRKEFLDDLFTFMQKRGTPVNRIPIMAKQTLDLYELFRLVVSKGGLVEVINKKLWREITKGLNLPSSITSAAFTLRTQYMKYLYPYECDKLKLSSLAELQSAIDGNRREGRRPGYGYDFSPIPSMLSTPPTPHGLNGPGLHPLANARPPTGLSPKDDDRSMLQMSHSSSSHVRSLAAAAEHDARAMEVATRAMEDLVHKRMEEVSRAAIASSVMTTAGNISCSAPPNKYGDHPMHEMQAPCKRPAAMFDDERFLAHMGMHSTHIKLNSSRTNGRLEYDSSMVVSMEINGMMYQGVLFAQHPRRI